MQTPVLLKSPFIRTVLYEAALPCSSRDTDHRSRTILRLVASNHQPALLRINERTTERLVFTTLLGRPQDRHIWSHRSLHQEIARGLLLLLSRPLDLFVSQETLILQDVDSSVYTMGLVGGDNINFSVLKWIIMGIIMYGWFNLINDSVNGHWAAMALSGVYLFGAIQSKTTHPTTKRQYVINFLRCSLWIAGCIALTWLGIFKILRGYLERSFLNDELCNRVRWCPSVMQKASGIT